MTQSLKCDTRHVVFFMKRIDFILDVGKITFFLSTIDETHEGYSSEIIELGVS